MLYRVIIQFLAAGTLCLGSTPAIADHITGWFKGPDNVVLQVRQQGLNVNGTLKYNGGSAKLSGSSNGGDYVRGTVRIGADVGTFELSLSHGPQPVVQLILYQGNFLQPFQSLVLQKFTPKRVKKRKTPPRKKAKADPIPPPPKKTEQKKSALPYDTDADADADANPNPNKKKGAIPY